MYKVTFTGSPVEIRYLCNLRDTAGQSAHAATFIRERLILLDGDLKRDIREHRRILLHELFHFAWVRLGNSLRREWENLLKAEWSGGARGEAGWSAEWRKRNLTAADVRGRTRRWREYCCESFCDTGAWAVCGETGEVTLGSARLRRRRVWFTAILKPGVPI